MQKRNYILLLVTTSLLLAIISVPTIYASTVAKQNQEPKSEIIWINRNPLNASAIVVYPTEGKAFYIEGKQILGGVGAEGGVVWEKDLATGEVTYVK